MPCWLPCEALLGEVALLLAADAGTDHLIRATLVAATCGLQNGMTSNFLAMPICTTHLPGMITDLGLLARAAAVAHWTAGRAALLTVTVKLFTGRCRRGVHFCRPDRRACTDPGACRVRSSGGRPRMACRKHRSC